MKRSDQRRKAKNRTGTGNGGLRRREGFYDDMLGLAGTLVRGQKTYGAARISDIAEATRNFADAVSEIPHLRVYVDSAAERLDELSEYVTEAEVEEMIDDVGDFARRYPFATLGIAIAAGVTASRLLQLPASWQSNQSSSPRSTRRTSRSTGPRKSTRSGSGGSRRPATTSPVAANG
jgi:hypothetical protein